MNRTFLVAAIALAVAAAVVAIYVATHPIISEDITVERDVQATNWGLVGQTFPFFSWIGDTKGFFFELFLFAVILLVNRPAWLFAAGAAASGFWYQAVSHIIQRPRPTTDTVLQVTEHPGASSFPSGHTIFITTVMVVIMLCIGYRFLKPRWARIVGWVVVACVIAANDIARVYTGAHWPTDVLAGMLIAGAWLCLVLALPFAAKRVLR